MLFHTVQGPQYPQQCDMPSISINTGRRLGENKAVQDKANTACAKVAASDRKDCIADVVATGDETMADIYM